MELEDLSRLFVETTGDALLAVELPTGNIAYVNPAFTGLTGLARDEVIGESMSVLSASYPQDLFLRDRPLQLEMLQTPGFYNDIALPTRDGQVRFVTVKVHHTTSAQKPLALAVLSDDTERQLLVRDLTVKHQTLEMAYLELEKMHTELKLTQEKVLQASKLMALGELAAGVSHELNQPLTGIRGFAQEITDLLKTEARPRKKEVMRLSELIMSHADRMASLLSHLRNFARQNSSTPSSPSTQDSLSLEEAWTNVHTLLARNLAKASLNIEFRQEAPLPKAQGSLHAVEQILINLLTNARDAIQEKQKTQPQHRGAILVQTGFDTDHVWMRVMDNGPGIPESLQKRIFDPFFTTKAPGQGMGLGLSISYGLAHKLGGELNLESTSLSGTTFLLKLPRVSSGATTTGEAA